MEQYSLLIIFMTMVVIWWVTWAPWTKRKPRDESPPGRDGAKTDRERR